MRSLRNRMILGLLALGLVMASPAGAKADEPQHSAITPISRPNEFWQKRQAAFNHRAAQGDIELIFLGDSITQAWEGAEVQQKVWGPFYGNRKAANMGIGGDRTQHVLWRLEHGNIEGISPKLVVLMIGTNNSNGTDNTAEEIAEGITAIVSKLRAKLPETKVLLLAIFPRGEHPNPQREKNALASELASAAADGEMVQYLDIGEKFLEADGSLSKKIMPDYLHLTVEGYQIWADAIEAKVAEMLGDS